jgi:hypothetical protein
VRLDPSRRHSLLTATSRRNPSSTIRILSSGVYLRRVAAFTVRTNDLVSWLRACAASVLSVSGWDTSAPFLGYSTLSLGSLTTSKLSGFLHLRCVPLSLTVYSHDPQWGVQWVQKRELHGELKG